MMQKLYEIILDTENPRQDFNKLVDARLTVKGQKEAESQQELMKKFNFVKVLVSPQLRTI